MSLKHFIAGIVAATLTASLVYFGMPAPYGEGSVRLNPLDNISQSTPLTSDAEKSQSQSVHSFQVTETETNTEINIGANENTEAQAKIETDTKTQPSFLDRFLGRKASTGDQKEDQKNIKSDNATSHSSQGASKNSTSETKQDGPFYQLIDGELVRITQLPHIIVTPEANNPTAQAKISAVMEQAAHIRQANLRDQAYMSVVDFSLSKGLFQSAQDAMMKVKQAELRDTARSMIAIAYAQKGLSSQAFEMIDDVEVDGLRDVMRLQVIDALIVPKNLPEQLRSQ